MLKLLLGLVCDLFRSRASLESEVVALRQQIALLQQRLGNRRVKLTSNDRVFWVLLSRFWPQWRSALAIVHPDTVLRWHRVGFRLYWRRISKNRGGRPRVDQEYRDLIARIARENPLWGAPRIHGELLMLAVRISESTVSRYLKRLRPHPSSQTWRTFIQNHVHQSIAVDFMVVPTIRFSLLYVFVVLDHGRRRILHVGVTAHPTAQWTAQQLTEALPWESHARFIHRDQDGIFGHEFQRRVAALELQEVVSARGSPWQNGYCERVIGTIRRECTDHVIAINENQLQRVIDAYVHYYNEARTHLSLAKQTPDGQRTPTKHRGRVVAKAQVGGLHHRYDRLAA